MNALKTFVILAALSALCFVALAAGNVPDRDRLIAQTDSGRVLYRMIACDPQAPTPEDCHAREQQRLVRRIHSQWISAAVATYNITLTPAEQAAVDRKTAAEEAHIQAAAARFKALADAALKIRRGEERSHVLAELARLNIPARDLDWELQHLPTLADAERTAAKDFVAEGRKSMRESFAHPYLLAHLHDLVQQRATAHHLPFDAAEEQFWSEVAQATHTRIVDPAFSMPERKGLLVIQ
jgi:hypothetical protein